ncbi:DUF1661 domain-containing protein [Porphyromonas gingivalis]|nr:DUF1661 domain-containing protein [Porphyromonas gingivalis]MDH7904016.1 DUF1661 domain-containing protein [Porphyromonas gingivalis]
MFTSRAKTEKFTRHVFRLTCTEKS